MEEKYTIQNTLHDVQTSWRDEELSVHKLNCRSTLLTASVCVCVDVSRALWSEMCRGKRMNVLVKWSRRSWRFIHSSRCCCSFTQMKCAERERWKQSGRVMSSLSSSFSSRGNEKLLLMPLLFTTGESAIRWCHSMMKQMMNTTRQSELKTLNHNCDYKDALHSSVLHQRPVNSSAVTQIGKICSENVFLTFATLNVPNILWIMYK